MNNKITQGAVLKFSNVRSQKKNLKVKRIEQVYLYLNGCRSFPHWKPIPKFRNVSPVEN